MATHTQDLLIIEAVETLSSIADLEFDQNIGIAQKHEIILGSEKFAYKTVHWLHQQEATSTVNLVKEIFRVILHYLRQFYRKEYRHMTDQQTAESIKSIMVLVGEAAKKLDKYTEFFHQTQKVTDFKEYQLLQEFYQAKIGKKIDEGALGKWVLSLPLEKLAPKEEQKEKKSTETKRAFVDFESVKKDLEYELFFIRKEDGSRFFSRRVLRNIKLVCDLGTHFGERKELDPLESINQWVDRVFHANARDLLKTLGPRLPRFFQETRKAKEQELVEVLNKALYALMFSSHAQNLVRHNPVKSCSEYFEDFLGFLRKALHSKVYQKWIVYPPKQDNHLAYDLIDLVQTLCRALYVNLRGLEEMKSFVKDLIQEASRLVPREQGEKSQRVVDRLSDTYNSLTQLLKHHTNGPLSKVIEMLEENAFHAFDLISQNNLPNQLFDLYLQEKRMAVLRIPAPIYQEFINKAVVNEEFKGFIRSYNQGAIPKKHLLINLQDRTSWREHARGKALEDLQTQPTMENAIVVVTLATNTEFYHQLSPYHEIHQAKLFKDQFKELLLDENTGYYFPPVISKQALSQFIDQSFDYSHKIFFSSKNVLSRENRLDFIEIFYFLLQLKLIDWVQPDSISLTCKDAIDTGEANSAALFAFLKLITPVPFSETDWNHLNVMLYGPALAIRERLMLPERFNRMLSALKVIENAKFEYGNDHFPTIIDETLSKLYQTPILHPQLLLSH